MPATTRKLYALPGSHPCAAVEAALRLKSLAFDRIELLPLAQLIVGPLRYGGTTVPGMRIDGERLVGSRAIMRRLDELAPEPPLLPPPGTPAYAQVLEAERWGDDVLQSVPRRVLDLAFLRKPDAMLSYAAGAKLPLPLPLLKPAAPLTARLMAMRNHAREDAVRADLAALPSQLDRIDGWIADGLLGGERPNAADLQIGSTIRLLGTIVDARPLIDGRPAAVLSDYFPPIAGEIPAGTLPAAWIPLPTSA
ncbi:MAG TPA: glutathione S-transferase N-terminal domain-containing protein [Solirubrobacteraceae bacterium]|jgi:glutathione S-transferase|nr:glutathione S-transferase N-terminal domain-containing protein [Solirubrobacteraceae bacterium]